MLAAAMDIVFASEDAKLLAGQLQYFTVPWDIGPRKAKEILFEHRVMSAHEARDLGMVNRVYPLDKLEEETLAFADRVADNFRDRVRGCKLAINHMMDTMGFSTEMDYAFHTHHLLRQMAYTSEEAVSAGVRGETSRERRIGRPDAALRNLELKQQGEV